jgi:hypothetical protein
VTATPTTNGIPWLRVAAPHARAHCDELRLRHA